MSLKNLSIFTPHKIHLELIEEFLFSVNKTLNHTLGIVSLPETADIFLLGTEISKLELPLLINAYHKKHDDCLVVASSRAIDRPLFTGDHLINDIRDHLNIDYISHLPLLQSSDIFIFEIENALKLARAS